MSELPGVVVCRQNHADAIAKAKALSFRVLAGRIEHGEPIPELDELFSVTS